MNDKNTKAEEMLRAYFQRETEELKYSPEKKQNSKKTLISSLSLVASLVLILSIGFMAHNHLTKDRDVMIYVSDDNVPMASQSNNSGTVEEHGPTKVGVIRIERSDLLYVTNKSKSGNGEFVKIKDSYVTKDKAPHLVFKDPSPLKTPIDEIVNSEEYSGGNNLLGEESLNIGYYNFKETEDTIEMTITYVDGSTSTLYIDVSYSLRDGETSDISLTLADTVHTPSQQPIS